MGKPEDLAPLAYQARVAAKLYARERSRVAVRIAANLFDGFRQLKRYGKFDTHGMTYDQIWEKYRKVILEDCDKEGGSCNALTEEDVTAQILEADVHRLVDPIVYSNEASNKQIRRYRTLRSVIMAKRRILGKPMRN